MSRRDTERYNSVFEVPCVVPSCALLYLSSSDDQREPRELEMKEHKVGLRRCGSLSVVCLVALAWAAQVASQQAPANTPIMRPAISEDAIPVQAIAPVARDGQIGEGFLRKPPGDGPFPAIVLIHGSMRRRPTEWIREYALSTHPSRFLEAGYVIAAITYRSRDIDPNAQTPLTLQDAVAAVDYLKGLPYVDPNRVELAP